PYPAENYRAPFEHLAPRRKPLEKPDVIVRLNEEGLWVECPGLSGVRLGVDPLYHRIYKTIPRVRGVSLGQDQKHIVTAVERANLITHALDLRVQTLYRIADFVVRFQRDMILHGARGAHPLTQKQVAEE